MTNSNKKRAELLGMPFGTASNRLRKSVMFHLLKKYGDNTCYQCKELIMSAKELSIEHKEPWMKSGNPIESFFDLDNIAFSHLSCNSKAAIKPKGIKRGPKKNPLSDIVVQCVWCGENTKPMRPHHYRDRLKRTKQGITCSHKCASELYISKNCSS